MLVCSVLGIISYYLFCCLPSAALIPLSWLPPVEPIKRTLRSPTGQVGYLSCRMRSSPSRMTLIAASCVIAWGLVVVGGIRGQVRGDFSGEYDWIGLDHGLGRQATCVYVCVYLCVGLLLLLLADECLQRLHRVGR